MHQPIRDHLETYIRDSKDPNIPREFHAHVAACPSCADQVQVLANHSRLLRIFRETDQVEPNPGFYGRVLNRIEQRRRPDSFWSVFLEPTFGRRLAYACTALLLVLGTYLVSTEPADQAV